MVAEGVVTALSAWQYTGIACCPVACMGGGGMGSFSPRKGTQSIIIAADNDAPGLANAAKLKRRLEKAGYPVRTIRPTIAGADFNHLLMVKQEMENE